MMEYKDGNSGDFEENTKEELQDGENGGKGYACNFDRMLLEEMIEEIESLKDLFVRRLSEDKQKNRLIQTIEEGARFAFIEPFLSDIILLLDRLEKSEDDFVRSVSEELYSIIERRGVVRIVVTREFDPSRHKAVRIIEDKEVKGLCVTGIIRNGYTFSGKVIRPAEVVVSRPAAASDSESGKNN